MAHEHRHDRIAEAAYFRAQRRGFESGGEVDDWLQAEREIDAHSGKGGAATEAALEQEAPPSPGAVTPAADERIPPEKVKSVARRLQISARQLRRAIFREGPTWRDVERGLDEDNGAAGRRKSTQDNQDAR
jgi:hypothetical protein